MSNILANTLRRTAISTLRRNSPFVISKRNAADITIWRPGPRPKTKEEIELAAAKYNMIPEDYKIHDEVMCLGDYPDIEPLCWPTRDPFYEWDDEYNRKCYGEPLPMWAEDNFGPQYRYEDNEVIEIPLWKMYCTFYLIVPTCILIDYFMEMYDLVGVTPYKPDGFIQPGDPDHKSYYFDEEEKFMLN